MPIIRLFVGRGMLADTTLIVIAAVYGDRPELPLPAAITSCTRKPSSFSRQSNFHVDGRPLSDL